MADAKFAPGFRLSVSDLFVLSAGVAGTLALGAIVWWYGLIVGLVVGHFFLFCNVFRMSRPLELVWAVAFVVLAGSSVLWGVPGWGVTTVVVLGIAAVVVAIEMRRPSYHGVGWQTINPRLRAWWAAQATRETEPVSRWPA